MCLAALCHYYGPICVNANIPFIMGGMVSARAWGAHIPHLSHFHHGGIRSAMGSEVRVQDLLNDHWLLLLLCKPPPCSPSPSSIPAPGPASSLTFPGLPLLLHLIALVFLLPCCSETPNQHFSILNLFSFPIGTLPHFSLPFYSLSPSFYHWKHKPDFCSWGICH